MTLRLILVGDVHLSFENIAKLGIWIKEKKLKFDALLVNGDICNINHSDDEAADNDKDMLDFKAVFKEFRKLEAFEEMVFIPGNHDPAEFFTSDSSSNLEGCTNAHLRSVGLRGSRLRVLGLGGSVAGLFKYNNEEAFPGYPFTSDDDVKAALDGLSSLEGPPYILMTHNGPSKSSTSQKIYHDREVLMGSHAIDSFIEANASKILVHIHGHSHEAWGACQLLSCGITIINPGSLKDGRFAILELESDSQLNWKVSGIQFYIL